MFVLSIIIVAAGLAMVLAHNIWSGGAQAVVVTLVGWLTLIKGLLYLLLFHEIGRGMYPELAPSSAGFLPVVNSVLADRHLPDLRRVQVEASFIKQLAGHIRRSLG